MATHCMVDTRRDATDSMRRGHASVLTTSSRSSLLMRLRSVSSTYDDAWRSKFSICVEKRMVGRLGGDESDGVSQIAFGDSFGDSCNERDV